MSFSPVQFLSPSKHRRIGSISFECICPSAARVRANGTFMRSLENCTRYAVGSLAILGVLAFLFAVFSADDDLTQQECLHSRKPIQVLLTRSKLIRSCCSSDLVLSTTYERVSSAIAFRLSRPFICISPIFAFETLPIPATGQRPPPSSQA